MWTAALRVMTAEERAELQRMLGEFSHSWRDAVESAVGRLFGADRGSDARLREGLRRDLQYGKVQVIHVTACDAVRLSDPDGSLAGFFVNIGGGLMMFVEPREWDAPASGSNFESLFPNDRFSLIRAPRSGVDLDFLCEGRRFDAAREIEAPPQEILDAVVRDGEILPVRLESLEDDFERLIGRLGISYSFNPTPG